MLLPVAIVVVVMTIAEAVGVVMPWPVVVVRPTALTRGGHHQRRNLLLISLLPCYYVVLMVAPMTGAPVVLVLVANLP